MQTSEILRIERSTFIRAPRSRVWKAISRASEFGAWFGVETKGEFTPGETVHMTTTHPSCPGIQFSVQIERIVPEQSLSWRWFPGASPDPNEPPTTVEFRLEDADGGTTVTVVESGFERMSLAKRAAAFADNDKGWAQQLSALHNYLTK